MKFINQIIHGDCLDVLKQIPSNSVDAIITDPRLMQAEAAPVLTEHKTR